VRNLKIDLREDYQQRYQSERSENILELVMRLFEDPYLDVNTAAEWLDVEYSTANRLIGQLADDGILEEIHRERAKPVLPKERSFRDNQRAHGPTLKDEADKRASYMSSPLVPTTRRVDERSVGSSF